MQTGVSRTMVRRKFRPLSHRTPF